MKGSTNQVALVAMLAFLAGCEVMTSPTTAQPGATVKVKNGISRAVPRTETLTTTSFGNYEFCVQVFPYYEFDLEQRVGRYRYENDKEWHTYTPIHAEAARAKAYFDGRAPAA
jgi:hypothetical protein